MARNKLLILLFLGLSAVSLHADCTDGPNHDTCFVPVGGTCQDIRDNITNAIDGNTVEIPAGTFVCSGAIQGTGGITISNKAITLKGQTTVNKINGSASGPAGTGGNDQTILIRQFGSTNPPSSNAGGLMTITTKATTTRPVRITGITFRDVSVTKVQNSYMTIGGFGNVRVDNCHFQLMDEPVPSQVINVHDGVRGVIDHNYIEGLRSQIWKLENGQSAAMPISGHYAWTTGNRCAQNLLTGWGSKDFIFFEDNYVFGSGTSVDLTDGDVGLKTVIRHNHVFNYRIAWHGTEGPGRHGGRAGEVYWNDFHDTRDTVPPGQAGDYANDPGGSRNGNLLYWSNTFNKAVSKQYALNVFRLNNTYVPCLPSVATCGQEGASGRCPWDVNETEGIAPHNGNQTGNERPGPSPSGGNYTGIVNGVEDVTRHRSPWQYYPKGVTNPSNARTFIEARNPPGSTPGPTPYPGGLGSNGDIAQAGNGTLFVADNYSRIVKDLPSTPDWTLGTVQQNGSFQSQWYKFGIFHLEDGYHSQVNNRGLNLANTTSVTTDGSNEKSHEYTWTQGSRFQIYKCLVALDQAGRGVGDPIGGPETGWFNDVADHSKPYYHTNYWTHQVVDPSYSWSNRVTAGGAIVGFDSGESTVHVNADYYNESTATGNVTVGVQVGAKSLLTPPIGSGTKIGAHGFDIAKCTPTVADYAAPGMGDLGVPGTAFWDPNVASVNGSTDTGALYVWFKPVGGTEGWNLWYQPYEYPHPCVKSATCAEQAPVTPEITSTATTFIRGNSNTFALQVEGFTTRPNVWELVSGSLPTNVSFDTGTGTLSGTANTATLQVYNLVFKATNNVPVVDEVSPNTNFKLTVTNLAPDPVTLTASNQVPLDSETVTFTATATPHGGATITKIEFFEVDNPLPLASDNSSPYTHAQTFSAGPHSIYAVATDSLGATGTSNTINLQVSNTSPVSVAITSPANGAVLSVSSNPISITATASTSSPGGISNVKFFVDGTVIAPTNGDTTSPYSTTATLATGTHTLTAQATNAVNTSQTSSPVTVTVTSPVPTPASINVKP